MEKEPKMDIIAEADNFEKNKTHADQRLISLIERVERLEEEKKGLLGDIRDIFAEAKSCGYDVKAIRAVLKLRKMNAADRDEQEFLINEYKRLCDM